ncbi:exopolysaccharide production repressor protein [Agrobacterium vitis]|uniref:exopolysaccharide production repressor protein n=1 Tax=Agrobacterium vitis TaxID=373 RepID=UPI0012E716D1|nr:exopolysaccharide production repressor protein [Agrobacterium vitis]MVA27535.1 exopolysaccharide production repressor exox [Agrobacterium vitis]
MHAPKVFFSMIGALLVFAVATYFLSGSLAGTLIKTVLAAIVLQVGYFCAVAYLVFQETKRRTQATGTSDATASNGAIHALGKTGQTALRNN